ncbi:MAG: hypothetical protein AAF543_17670 [Pseudomonadota bacterium]
MAGDDGENTKIGGSRHITVQLRDSLHVGLERTVDVKNADHISIGADRTTTIFGRDDLTVGERLTITASEARIITGKASLVLKKDGSIQLKGKSISIESDGDLEIAAKNDLVLKGSRIRQS